ncbi:MAG: glycosyltransferase family 2 protein [Geminicoccaceae bacterium]
MAVAPGVTFSVAIPTYNRAHVLGETLESVFGQEHPPVQVVVVDDGSADATQRVLTEFAGRVVWRRIANAGPSAARKAAIALCTSPWIALCDSDDLWRPDHLERRARLIATFPEADFTFSNFTEFGEEARRGYDKFKSMPSGWWDRFPQATPEGFRMLGSGLFAKFLEANAALVSTIAIKRSLYDHVGGIREKFSRVLGEDADLTRRCVAEGCVACDTAITVELRKHSASFSGHPVRNLLGRIEILEESLRDGSVPEAYRSEVIEAIGVTRQQALRAAFYRRDFEAFRCLSGQVSFSDLPFDLKLRGLFACLPKPLRDSLIRLFEQRS